ncbi:hypothetical protein GLOIN_2v1430842 [Rhizophagus clarus]|uniref:Uncharacterized protein n=1 Tax=Rhizophagus clarus TaxID=94130 RepID=A0A8H3KVI0_9GLOM|nr:hypothetical protein GLOIN_2v1430842 [Rhizophagus clarus]
MQYQNPSRAEELCYQYIYTSRDGFGKDGKIGDVFDGECYFNLLKMRNVPVKPLTNLIGNTSGSLIEIKIDYISHNDIDNKRIIHTITIIGFNIK